MLDIGAAAATPSAKVLALPVRPDEAAGTVLVPTEGALPEPLREELEALLDEAEPDGSAGTVQSFPRPGRDPGHILLVGLGDLTTGDLRAAGAALARTAANRHVAVTFLLPAGAPATAAGHVAEGAWLGSYRFQLKADPPTPKLRRIALAGTDREGIGAAIERARSIATAVILARDLTNTPSAQKSPQWIVDRVAQAARRRDGVTVTVHDEAALASGGFGGILAIGAGSARPPRLLELSWRPRGARTHVALVGKGITFDTGGISLKPLEGMKLMRKDMAGAAAVCAAVLGAADLGLPVRVTALAPLAENMVSGAAIRPGDVVRHYGGLTTEVQNTDGEGRVVLGDALAYAVRRHKPDLLVNLATLTGASHVALGKRTAALFSHDDKLAAGLSAAGEEVGERMWRLPLPEDYLPLLSSDVADLNNVPVESQAGAVVAALYLREFTGDRRQHWAHIDMSAPAWIEKHEGSLVKGATGWGVRMLLRWLEGL